MKSSHNFLRARWVAAGLALLLAGSFSQAADAPPAIGNGEKQLPLHRAIESGDLAAAQVLLTANPKLATATDSTGHTALHLAAQLGNGEATKLLLKKGAAEDARTAKLETPLYLASQRGHLEVVKTLVEAHAGINITDTEGRTPLIVAAKAGHLATVQFLLDNGAQPNASMNTGDSALCFAVQEGHLEIVRLLLEMGSLATFRTRSGETPLSVARKQKNQPMIALLEKAGARMPGPMPDAPGSAFAPPAERK